MIVSCYVENLISPKEDLSDVVARIQSTEADIIKVVTDATDITELSKLFHLLSHCQVRNFVRQMLFCHSHTL